MLNTLAGLLSSIPTFLFPVFASYKALKTSDPALLTPWLMYWVVLACALFFESWTAFILDWIPLYSWIRLGFLLYLILPQTQGAKHLYQTHVHPFLQENELAIDEFISSAHDRAKAAGVKYFKQAIELIKQHIFGFSPKEITPPSTPSKFNYAQRLFARFNLPSPKATMPASSVGPATSTASDFYSLLASAVNVVTSRDSSSANTVRDLSNSGILIPPSVSGEERLSFIDTQRESLAIVLSALEKEASSLSNDSNRTPVPSSERKLSYESFSSDLEDNSGRIRNEIHELSKSRSETDFEKIEAESAADDQESQRHVVERTSSSGNWLPWSWGTHSEGTRVDTVLNNSELSNDMAKSTGVDK
ncbi:hypothetical protein K3495_g9629 [Podosphaera aphanis]|nr:hypothetical protein K3495_g9629 [Podosphaera aphanis]